MNNLINVFLKYGKKRTYKINEVIFNENEVCDSVSFIYKGKVKISTFSNYENEVVINLLNKGEFFGDLLLFSSIPNYLGIGVCLEYTEIFSLKKELLLNFLSDKSLLEEFLMLITNKGVSLKQTNKLLTHKNIEERVIYYFNHICKKNSEGYIYYKSITDMANILSIPRPSLSRVLHKMEKDNKIIIEKNRVKL